MDRSMIVMEVLLLEYGSLEWDRVIDLVHRKRGINTKDNERKSSVSLHAEENKRDSISPRLSNFNGLLFRRIPYPLLHTNIAIISTFSLCTGPDTIHNRTIATPLLSVVPNRRTVSLFE